MDPTEATTHDAAPDTAPATPETPAAAPTPEAAAEPELSPIDRGLKEAAERGEGGYEPPKPKADAKPGAKPEGEPEAGKEGEGDPKAAKGKDKGKPEPDADVEKEIAERGLTGKSADRFRELNAKAKVHDAVAPLLDELKITPEQLPEAITQLRTQASRAVEYDEVITAHCNSPEQFGRLLTYAANINSGDPAKMRQAYDAMVEEQKWLAQELGIAAPGYDPLAKHQDLADAVAGGTMDRAHALEVAEARRLRELNQQAGQRQTEQQKTDQARTAGAAAVTALGNELAKADPHYAAKLPALKPAMQAIRDAYPPEQWAAKVREAYQMIPNPAPAAPARAPITSPVRPTGAPTTVVPEITSKNALEEGLKQAHRLGLGGL